ncbi:MAG TPA: ATP-binding protein [Sphingomonas sp.]
MIATPSSWLVRRARRTPDDAGARNMLLLTQFRWVAIAGQLATILFARWWIGVALPLVPMAAILVALALLNVVTLGVVRRRRRVANYELFLALLVDWAALTAQLYLSGGTTNPFASIGLLQVVLGAVLLEAWSSWALVALHSVAFGLLALIHEPLDLPPPYASQISSAHTFASWINFMLASILVVLFVTRIGRNLRIRDRRLAEMRQREAEEDHIVRMGLLASGAAHELGTPLASMSVILGDWAKEPRLTADPALEEEIGEMRTAVARCKQIVGGILYASGEIRSESVERTTLDAFLRDVARSWDALKPGVLTLVDRVEGRIPIAADRTLAQVIGNLLDNAAEAGATRITLDAQAEDDDLIISVSDDGPGFAPETLEMLGKPYNSSRDRRGAGLGLFLAVNVMRKLGGSVAAANGKRGGAVVTLTIPLDSLELDDDD